MDPLNGETQISAPDGDTAVPIQVLGEGSAVVRDVVRLGRPALITEDGVGVAAIVDASTYEALRLSFLAVFEVCGGEEQSCLRRYKPGSVLP